MADVNLASLNFELIVNDDEFNKQIQKIKKEADDLNASITEMLNVKGGGLISQEEHQSAMRRLREEFQEAQNQQRLKLQWSKETAKMASDEAIAAGKIAQQQEKANNEKKKGLVIDEQIAAATNRKAEAEINATAATERKVKAERDAARAEIQRQTAAINQAAAEERKLTATNNRIRSQQRLNAEMDREGTILRRNSRIWNDMKNVALAYFSFDSARRIISSLVQISAEFEKQRVSLRAILQDMDGADKIFNQIKSLAVESPFQFKELVTYTKQLSAFSVPMNELYDTTKMLADVSAGLGVSMDRLVLAYGQIRSASFLRGQEVRQLTEAGIPILAELSDMFTELEGHYVSAGDVFDKISKRQVTFEMVAQVFQKMTSEGGKFYQMQEVLAQTLSGKISNLKDAYQIMFAEIGEKTSGVLYKSVDALRALAENYEKVGKTIVELVSIYGTYRAMTAAVNFGTAWGKASALAIIADGSLARGAQAASVGLANLVRNTKLYQAANAAVASINPYAILAAAVVALGVHVYNLVTATTKYEDALKGVNDAIDETTSKADAELATLKYMFSRMEALNTESEEYKNIRKQIINQYGDYLSDIDKENLALGELTGIYDKLASAVKKVSMEKAAAAARDKISEYVNESVSDVRKQFTEALEKAGIDKSGSIANELRDYIFGDKSDLSKDAEKAAKKIANQSWWKTAGKNIAKSLLGEFSMFVKDSESVSVDKFKDMFQKINEEAQTALDDIPEGLKWLSSAWGGNNEGKNGLTGWRQAIKEIADEATRMKAATGIEVDAASDLIEVYDQISKAADKAAADMERYRRAGETDLYESEKNRLAYLNSMKARLGGDAPGGSGGGGASGDPFKKDVENIQAEIKLYQRLKEVYESLVQYMSSEDAKRYMSSFFPQYGDMINDDYDAEINRLSNELAKLAIVNENAAKAWLDLQDAFSQNKVNSLIDAKRAAEEYANWMENWMNSSELFGEGAEFNVSKIVAKYKKNIKKLMDERDKGFDEAWKAYASGENGIDYFEEEEKIIEGYLIQSDNALREANEEIRKQAEIWVKEWGKINNIDLSHMADLTERELATLQEELAKLMNNPDLYLSDKMKASLGDMEGALEIFVTAIQKYIESLTDESKEKSWDKLTSKVKRYERALKITTKAVRDLSNASGLEGLSDMADHIDRAADAATRFVEALAKGEEGEAIMVAVSYVAEEMMHAVTAAIEYRNTIRELQREMRVLAYESQLAAGVDTIFGTDTYRSLLNAVNLSRQLESNMRHLSDTLSKIGVHVDTSKWWQYILAPTAPVAWYQHFFGSKSISDILGEMGQSLFDANGRVNVEALKQIESSYKKLSEAQHNALKDAIADAEAYNAALDQIDKSMESLVGNVADDFADAFIEQWKQAGDAAMDYADILDDLANTYAKMFVRNAIMESLFDKDFQKQITDLTINGKAAEVLAEFAKKAEQLKDLYPTLNQIMEGLSQYFTTAEDESKSTLGGGVKSITEETASLLASYINAIRADVAAIRQEMAAQSGALMPAPTLAEYLTQIQANTFNTAQNTADLLADLRSMMTVSDGPALRVFM